ncbi:hypothetical protein [uncultured Cohaesibacter sp.]|uniref:hypothetical protein n=1 Tax=uncultured Cohaesibacter sp. TaxID=1002546 RepID=UPI0029C9772A|nr:hypothetical protein [uncultured Cohaesibacter sp.]
MKNEARLSIRLPIELKEWLDQMKENEVSSINYEIVRSIRERKARHEQGVA